MDADYRDFQTAALSTPTPTPEPCPGDCDRNDAVTVDELVTVVNIALGTRAVVDCPAGDVDESDQITVDEVVAAVQSALTGCRAAHGARALGT